MANSEYGRRAADGGGFGSLGEFLRAARDANEGAPPDPRLVVAPDPEAPPAAAPEQAAEGAADEQERTREDSGNG
jgi:hypothetical protein